MQMSITWLINSYLAFWFLLFSMTTLLQLGVYNKGNKLKGDYKESTIRGQTRVIFVG